MWIGTEPRTGFGFDEMLAKSMNSPWNETSSFSQSARITAAYSSVRRVRPSQGTSSASNSSRSQPIPTPRITRPFDIMSSVATSFA
jgi:hypothetical protein